MSAPSADVAWVALGTSADGWEAVILTAAGSEGERRVLATGDVATWVRRVEASHAPRWIWSDTDGIYRRLLAAGVRVARCHDLRLAHAILRSPSDAPPELAARADPGWDAPRTAAESEDGDTLFSLEPGAGATRLPQAIDAVLREFMRQRESIAASASPASLRLLLAAESAGALAAAEMTAAGLPWDTATHDRVLSDILGPRPRGDELPERMRLLAEEVRAALGDPAVSLDSPPKLLRALHRVGIHVETTSRWELERHTHPAIGPLVHYKRMSRLLTANGWSWLDEWVHDGRFRPMYVPGGVVTGRWASSGGGALQIPRVLRDAVRADPGWCLVVADVAQLEPRVLAAMAGDLSLAVAARGRDLYEGVVATGAVATRSDAKMALLGAMYGATTGESGRLVPRLRRSFPRAMALVDEAARLGEDGGVVRTWWGRTSPPPSPGWRTAQDRASESDATIAEQERARRSARDRGRFTRNFVVQGTAAEWALAWIADLRGRLHTLGGDIIDPPAVASGPVFDRHPHLAFFLHDEIIVHAPLSQAEEVADAVRAASVSATRLLFGDFPLDFPLDLRITQSAAKT
ncbi:bifunctional 3'-5' exonuclease/DNA polymerase [Microbacterium sp. ABRD28]|uniref:bifunctional 3'-5' exonuclease/DNA polymerase n=1 Tax=Microbacterium sp. ABRD28 TaxID=2268461 RepID=UPI000F54DCCD|nr:bifunctional 3'-5' exonuclease/DNA polymerase [Microbacterium sp. ABRD28]AZC14028.1 bifunctional 3'-5' exonuclease/DNA polymerase [Microbacterium sp. ABRD28]